MWPALSFNYISCWKWRDVVAIQRDKYQVIQSHAAHSLDEMNVVQVKYLKHHKDAGWVSDQRIATGVMSKNNSLTM